jgi:hypothetical protein
MKRVRQSRKQQRAAGERVLAEALERMQSHASRVEQAGRERAARAMAAAGDARARVWAAARLHLR